MSIRIVSHNNGQSAKALALALGNENLLKKQQPLPLRRFVRDALVINFGCHPDSLNFPVDLNQPAAVSEAADKVTALTVMSAAGVPVVPFSTSPFDVIAQCPQYNHNGVPTKTIVARTLTRASEGRGIEMIDCNPDGSARTEVVDAPLYTAYIPKHAEFRVHVGVDAQGIARCIDITKKARRTDTPDAEVNWRIRNYDNGFIFAREGIDLADPLIQRVQAAGCRAVVALGLDFGAVDIVVQANTARSVYVLEVNTAPGMEGTTLARYTQYFQYISDPSRSTFIPLESAAPAANIPHQPSAPETVHSQAGNSSTAQLDVGHILNEIEDLCNGEGAELTPDEVLALADALSVQVEALYSIVR